MADIDDDRKCRNNEKTNRVAYLIFDFFPKRNQFNMRSVASAGKAFYRIYL